MATNQLSVTPLTNKETIQIGDNNYQFGTYAHTGAAARIPVGTIVARNTTTGNLVPLDLDATTTNANSPVGFITDARDFGASEAKKVTYVIDGKINEDVIKLPASITMTSIIGTTGTPGAKTLRDYLTGMGFVICKPQ